MKKAALYLVIAAVLAGVVYLLLPYTKSPGMPYGPFYPEDAPPAGEITLVGTMVCLPHWDTKGPQTLECAFGLEDQEGRYYGLRDTDPMYQNVSNVPMNTPVEVHGVFTPGRNPKYQGVGTIEVESIAPADTPKRGTLSGVYLCLPHSGPQTEECAYGVKGDDGSYWLLDLMLLSAPPPSLSAGDRIRAEGVITPIERLSTDRWQNYPIEGIFSVTSLEIE